MIRKFFIHGLIWVVIIIAGTNILGGFFSKPKRAGTSAVSESDNPFTRKGSGDTGGKNISEPPTPVDPTAVILTGKLDHTLVEIQKCVGNGSELTIEGTLLNQGVDGVLKFYIGSYSNASNMYDDYGNKATANYIQIANISNTGGSIDAKLISGVPTKFLVRFQVATVAGETQARMVKVFQLATDGFQTEFRNIKVDKVSKNTVIATPVPTPILTSSPTPTPTPITTPTAKINN